MLIEVARRIFGSRNSRILSQITPIVEEINSFSEIMEKMSDEDLKNQTEKFRNALSEGKTLDDILPEAYATVREAAKRTLGERHYDTQLIGGIMLHKGYIAEMKTGEGKTLVATLPSYLNALDGKGVHVITVNDYLAKRDSQWMAQVYNFLGLSCAYLTSGIDGEERKQAYKSDILYATNNELGFDYLRDNMTYSKEQLVQRDLNFAIVDEVDSILIDEARIPLIISGAIQDKKEYYTKADQVVSKLVKDEDFNLDEKARTAALTDKGSKKVEDLLKQSGVLTGDQGLYDLDSVDIVHHVNIAIQAHHLFAADRDYIVRDGKILLIDSFTGRISEGRSLSFGLHQAIETKEGLNISKESQSLASITYQNFFKLYNKLSGMTGTAMTEVDEFEQIYKLQVVEIPTFRPVRRVDENDAIYQTKKVKLNAVIQDVKSCYEKGQPVLIGAGNIDNSEVVSDLLKKSKIPHNVLNAKNHEQEAEIIAQAGRPKAVTVATNMAGRGTDIKLGGSLSLMLEGVEDKKEIEKITAAYEKDKKLVQEVGGLRIISTQRNESRRIDNQLRGRSGRQGDVGSSKFYLSLDDDLMRIFASGLKGLMERFDYPADEVLENKLITRAMETAQRKIESMNFDQRKEVLKYDDVINNQRKVIYAQRKEILVSEPENIKEIISGLIEDTLEEIVYTHGGKAKSDWDVEGLQTELHNTFNISPNLDDFVSTRSIEKTIENLLDHILKIYEEKAKKVNEEIFRMVERDIFLRVMDNHWRAHIKNLDFLQSTVHFRSNAQKNPLNEYRTEAFDMFGKLLKNISRDVVTHIMYVQLKEGDKPQEPKPVQQDAKDMTPPKSRNAPCPCGSGNRYKHCCGKI